MVKDILREIKRKFGQFIAITLITMLGVGFYVGIQVTGYDMRQTGDAYMESHDVLDYNLIHSLGIDEPFLEEVKVLLDAQVWGVYDEDVFMRNDDFDEVMHLFAYTDATRNDLTLKSGRYPQEPNEIVVDHVMETLNGFKIGDTFKIHKHNIFDSTVVTIVGFVESSLYMNLERGNSNLGIGKVSGFAYGLDLPFVDNPQVYSSLRIKDAKVANPKYILSKNEATLSLNRFNRASDPVREALADAQKELDTNREKANTEFTSAERELKKAKQQLDDARIELEMGLDEISGMTLSGTLDERLVASRSNYDRFVEISNQAITRIKLLIEEEMSPLVQEALMEQLDALVEELKEQTLMYEQGFKQLEEGVAAYNEGYAAYEKNEAAYLSQKQSAINALDAAQKEIDQGYKDLANAEHGFLLVQEREDAVIGYKEFYDDSNRVEGIGKVFPMIFFFVSILVTLSTVTRMIDESRMQIGVYKALGYSSLRTSMKYVYFIGLAWLAGSILGLYFGFYFIPQLIYNAYRIMYLTPELVDGIVLSYAILPLTLSFICSVGVTFAKSYRVTTEKTAHLLRPVAPKVGQRIFLERLPIVWNRFSFLYKVSFRNLFRNKTRFLMTVIGIGGCCGLIITGTGLAHSIYSVVDKQFGEIVQYDGLAYYESFDFDMSSFTKYENTSLHTVKVNNYDVSFYAVEDMINLNEFMTFRNRKTKEVLNYEPDDVIITEKLARLLDVKEGDSLSFTLENHSVTLTVDWIMENYAGHSIYTSLDAYEMASGKTLDTNLVLFNTDIEDLDNVAKSLLEDEHVISVQFLDDVAVTYANMMRNFDVVIWVVVLCALALEVLVLMNLISMNMSERKKELATLKVLGFYANELATYVLRENIILTFISLIFGVLFGKVLHYYVITSAEIDVLMFNYELRMSSYLLACALTVGLSVLINFVMARRANQVNMSEALKTFDA